MSEKKRSSLSQAFNTLQRRMSGGSNRLSGSNSKKLKENEKPIISNPSNFEHTVHVGFDPHTGEFTGMPESWAKLLSQSNISKMEQKKNPQAVLDVLNYYDATNKEQQEPKMKYMTNIKPPSADSMRPTLSDKFSNNVVISPQKVEQATHASEEEEEEAPPPVATRPDKTKSIYTKPIEIEEKTNGAIATNKNDKPKKRKMTDEEILENYEQLLPLVIQIGNIQRWRKLDKVHQELCILQ